MTSEDPTAERRRPWLLPAAALGAIAFAVLVALPVAGGIRLPDLATSQNARLPFAAGETPQGPTSVLVSPVPAPEPTASAQSSAAPAPTTDQSAEPQPASVAPAAGDPVQAIKSFYQLIEQHQFDSAAQLWSRRMLARYPPREFIFQRFASTQRIDLRAVDLVADNGRVATVSIDLIEVSDGSARHWVGSWQLVLGPSGWLLNKSRLSTGNGD